MQYVLQLCELHRVHGIQLSSDSWKLEGGTPAPTKQKAATIDGGTHTVIEMDAWPRTFQSCQHTHATLCNQQGRMSGPLPRVSICSSWQV